MNGVILRIVYAIDVWHDDRWDTDGMPLWLACPLSQGIRCVGLCWCSKMRIGLQSIAVRNMTATLFRSTSVHVVWYDMTESNARYERILRCLVKAAYWLVHSCTPVGNICAVITPCMKVYFAFFSPSFGICSFQHQLSRCMFDISS